MARTSLVVTFTGPDRPGIVASFARVVSEHGGNWEEGRMARLAGQFAGILEVTVDAARAQALTEELARVSGLRVTVDEAGRAPEAGGTWLELELTGQDREGIVREVAAALVAQGVSIEELHTESESAPMSGERLFHAHAELRCPENFDQAALKAALEAVSGELLVDIRLSDTHG